MPSAVTMPGMRAQRLERFDLTAESALDAADLVVQRFVAVEADGDDRLRRPAAGDPFDARDDAVGQEPVGREMQEREPAPAA